jgi:hypothetical protein
VPWLARLAVSLAEFVLDETTDEARNRSAPVLGAFLEERVLLRGEHRDLAAEEELGFHQIFHSTKKKSR